MATNEFSTFHKAIGLEPHHQMRSGIKFKTLVRGSNFFADMQSVYSVPQAPDDKPSPSRDGKSLRDGPLKLKVDTSDLIRAPNHMAGVIVSRVILCVDVKKSIHCTFIFSFLFSYFLRDVFAHSNDMKYFYIISVGCVL